MPSVATIDIHLFAIRNKQSKPRTSTSLGGSQIDRIEVQSDQLCPFECSMERLGALLSDQPRCYFEWDGSFVWTGEIDQQSPNESSASGIDAGWTLSGMIYDTGTQISRVELRGQCPLPPVQQVAQWLESAEHRLVVQLMTSGAFIDGSELEKIWHA